MTDTTNHAEVIREALQCLKKNAFDGYGNPMPANANEAIESLDALTREADATIAALDQRHEEDAAEVKRLNHALTDCGTEVMEQAERIKALEEANVELTRKGEDLCCAYGGSLIRIHDLERLATEILDQFVHEGHPGQACRRSSWVPVDTLRSYHAALAPKEAQK